MTVLIFNIALSVLLGYSLFAAITGKLNPLNKPDALEQRPGWIFGLWASLALTLVLCTGVHLTHGLPSGSSRELLVPGALLMLFLVTPGFIFFVFYRRNIQQQLDTANRPGFDWADFPVELTHSTISKDRALSESPDSDSQGLPGNASPEKSDNVTPAYLPRAELFSLNTQELPDAVNDAQQPPAADQLALLHKRLLNEATLRKKTENKLLAMKKELVLARREIRRSTAARAKALSTANKAIAFARQAVETRARLESEMLSKQDALRSEQTTINTLSRALAVEKQRTQQDIKSIARQMFQSRKQEDSSHSEENIAETLETRLDSGYEQQKATLSDVNQGKAS